MYIFSTRDPTRNKKARSCAERVSVSQKGTQVSDSSKAAISYGSADRYFLSVRRTTAEFNAGEKTRAVSDQLKTEMSGLNLDSHVKAFMASLRKLQEKEVMTDVTLILPDQSAIPCHKVVLMAASPFFDTMFQSGLKEGAEQNIQLDFADSDIIKTLVEFFYTGDIELTEGNIKEIVAGSDFLCCEHLEAHCEEYLIETVDLSNCISYYQLGKVFDLKLLINTAFDFIMFKFQKFREISDFNILTEDELVEVVSCDRLNVENEDVVFEAVVYWVNADPDAREEVFPRIAPLIRFPFCSETALTENICCNTLMQTSGCIDFAHEALWSQFHLNCRPPIHNARCIPRHAFYCLFQLIELKFSKQVALRVASYIDGSGIKWETVMPRIAQTCQKFITSPFGLYLIDNNDCYFVEHKLRRVTPLPWKPVDLDSTLAFINGRIFAFGGWPASKSVKSINLKESNPEWKSEQDMLSGEYKPLIVQFANKVYAFGGWRTRVTQEFDPASNEWRMRSEMPWISYGTAVAFGNVAVALDDAAVALGDKIYIFGNHGYSYDPENDKWEVLSKPTHAYSSLPSATVWNGKILLGNRDHAEEYDPVADRWSNRDELLPDWDINKMILHASCTLRGNE
ncbi:hypothetical protein CAPTEDRAFT_226967 [Capitella teleta]|uniref:BTB domain-containing protein n=1 Tax=Capitella teleta TaxID=283909 RepID=R7TIF2_CAPTE|nr:hypothetical protein CAPTEDRAFT_226967 [Capitella teleta]|eukprot:ELT90855.1 hypothetical protein CAPTEDRAFT_226967 [Capitella teleta]